MTIAQSSLSSSLANLKTSKLCSYHEIPTLLKGTRHCTFQFAIDVPTSRGKGVMDVYGERQPECTHAIP